MAMGPDRQTGFHGRGKAAKYRLKQGAPPPNKCFQGSRPGAWPGLHMGEGGEGGGRGERGEGRPRAT